MTLGPTMWTATRAWARLEVIGSPGHRWMAVYQYSALTTLIDCSGHSDSELMEYLASPRWEKLGFREGCRW